MNRQRGLSSLGLVLLLLILGSMTLTGLGLQLDAFTHSVASESLTLQRQTALQSALEWGRVQQWQAGAPLECRQAPQGQVCLRQLDEGRVVLIAQAGDMLLWRIGEQQKEQVRFSPHGWSDFCPLKEKMLCQVP